ncbi:MAG: hypothetical protein H6754_06775 [Candidatus Omnitrophica bacterium]|nr:hypothetical protein [Candidatus Omnitrophota bacterium]
MKSINSFGIYHNPPLIIDHTRDILIDPNNTKILSQKVATTKIKPGYKIDVFVDGLFKFTPKQPVSYSDIEQMTNIFFFCLYAKLRFFLPKMNASLYEVIHYNKNNKIKNYGINPLNKIFFEARDPSTYKAHPILDWRNKFRYEIKSSSIKNAAQLAEKLLNLDIDLTIFNLINKSHVAYQNYDFNMTLAFNWLAAEYFLSKLFDNFISKNRKTINRDRKSTLEHYMVSEKIEIMNLSGLIDFNLYQEISHIRKKRNKYFHDLRPINKEDAVRSIELTQSFLKIFYNLQLNFRYGLFIAGI